MLFDPEPQHRVAQPAVCDAPHRRHACVAPRRHHDCAGATEANPLVETKRRPDVRCPVEDASERDRILERLRGPLPGVNKSVAT